MTTEQQKFLKTAALAAVVAERSTGFPAEITVAQAIFESAWGTRAPGNNYFGIKPDHHGSGVVYTLTHEFVDGVSKLENLAFEAYATMTDCFADHTRLLISGAPYLAAWKQYQSDHKMDDFIRRFCPKYATDPAYTQKILAESHSSSVALAVQQARENAATA